jgi:undecaprenyl-diphosphatase
LEDWLHWLGDWYSAYGYPMVLLAATLENTALVTYVVPGGTMIIFGGHFAAQGKLDLLGVIAVAWLGTVLGTSFDFMLGRMGHRTYLRHWLARPAVARSIERASAFLWRYGLGAILVGHFIPPLRTVLAVAAGMTQLPYWRFLLYEICAALAWSSLYAAGGYLLSDQISLLVEAIDRLGWLAAAGVAVAIATVLVWRRTRRRRVD